MPSHDHTRAPPRLSQSTDLESLQLEKNHALQTTVGLRDRIKHFTWPWFAATMSTGAISVILKQTPNRFTGLNTIGTIFFILDLVLFIIFTCLMLTRAILVPRRFLASLYHPAEGLFFGTFWVSISLLLNCAASYGVPSTGPWLVTALEVCFWLYCAIVFCVAVGQYFVLIRLERLNVKEAMPTWVFPVYPLLVVGPMAGAMIPYMSPGAAWNMWVAAFLFQGMAWTIALMMYVMYMQRLMSNGLPLASKRPGMYIAVGPAGYSASGLIVLALRAPTVIPASKFTANSSPDGAIIKDILLLVALFITLFAYWFFFLTSAAVISGAWKMHFTLNWWGFVFPNSGLALATVQAGAVLESPGINGVASAWTVLLVFMWFFVAVSHIRAVWKRDILWPGKDEDCQKTVKRAKGGA